jgi:hypothetical protein
MVRDKIPCRNKRKTFPASGLKKLAGFFIWFIFNCDSSCMKAFGLNRYLFPCKIGDSGL